MTLLDRSALVALGRLTNQQGDAMSDEAPAVWWSPAADEVYQASATGFGYTAMAGHTSRVKLPADAVRLVAAAVPEADVDDDCRNCDGSQRLCSGLAERGLSPCCSKCAHGAAVPEAGSKHPEECGQQIGITDFCTLHQDHDGSCGHPEGSEWQRGYDEAWRHIKQDHSVLSGLLRGMARRAVAWQAEAKNRLDQLFKLDAENHALRSTVSRSPGGTAEPHRARRGDDTISGVEALKLPVQSVVAWAGGAAGSFQLDHLRVRHVDGWLPSVQPYARYRVIFTPHACEGSYCCAEEARDA